MPRFLETICILDGQPLHLDWHQRRVEATLHQFHSIHSEVTNINLGTLLAACDIPTKGVYRARVLYDIHSFSIEFFEYPPRMISSLQLMAAPYGYDYSYKYADRKVLEDLYAQRGDADDVLITRDGWITDTSIANIAFGKGDRWYTSSRPLLAGTTWKRLVANRVLIPRAIHQHDISKFDTFKIFNAMIDFEETNQVPVNNIIF